MPTIETTIKSRVDLDAGVQKTALRMLFAAGDGDAHKIEVSVTRGGEPVDLSGASVAGSFIRARDNATVLLTGSVSGNSALISLSPACYNASGAFSVAVRLTLDGQKHTIFYGTGSVAATSTDMIVNEEDIIPSLNDLLAQIDRMENGTQAANAAAASANGAASAANAAAQNANTKADVANQAASNANTQASAAQAAAQKIDAMTVSAQTLVAGSQATAQITDDGTKKIIAFGIPKGDKGDKGEKGDTGATGPMADGLIYETTADALKDMSQEQRAALYDQGYRAIVATYNDTVTMHALAADGSLAWIGCNQDTTNLLDNSYFVRPINQRGETSKQESWVYWLDRWIADTEKVASQLASSGIHLPGTAEKNARILQRVPISSIKKGQSYTIAVYDASGNVFCVSGVFNGGTLAGDGLSEGKYYLSLQYGDSSTYYYCILDAYADITVKAMALYEGEYTTETLPPYVPKGYAAELAECLRYYRKIKGDTQTFAGYATDSVAYAFIPLAQAMRIAPTVTVSGKIYYVLGSTQGTSAETGTLHRSGTERVVVKYAVSVTGICTGVITPQGDIDISADL